MYTAKPRGINIKQNDRDVQDGFLQESINMQWRDGAYRPIPERLSSGITDTEDKQEIILHKVSDEDTINVLMFDSTGVLYWHGSIVSGSYVAKITPTEVPSFPIVTDFESLSFTILNGLIYFMSSSQEFYYRLQFNENSQEYEIKDMYAWKDLIPFYPYQDDIEFSLDAPSGNVVNNPRCGVVCVRFALVLKTGEVVMHSPIYPFQINGIEYSSSGVVVEDVVSNIHTIINLNLEYLNNAVFQDEISAINVYSSVPYYLSKYNYVDGSGRGSVGFSDSDIRGEVQRLAETPFYLIKTIKEPSDSSILLHINFNSSDISITEEHSKVDMSTIAAGEIMPVDNFSYHKLFGKITSNNGRIIIETPKTIMSNGYMRSLAYQDGDSEQGFEASTEDGDIVGVSYSLDKTGEIVDVGGVDNYYYRGVVSYPDAQATYAGTNNSIGDLNLLKLRGNNAHNMACAFEIDFITSPIIGFPSYNSGNSRWEFDMSYNIGTVYKEEKILAPNTNASSVSYTSENRFQFSESGEFSVWPAINSYRVGDGKIMFVGVNSVDPANTDYIAPLFIGTTDGIYTVNFDVTGNNLIQSITQTAKIPALSSENIQIDQALIFIGDKGLMVVGSGKPVNLTENYFQEQGNDSIPIEYNYLAVNLASYLGGIPAHETIYPNYGILTSDFFGEVNPYYMIDVIEYMKGAIFAYDSRRNNLWCSNPDKSFSLIFNFTTKQWDMSTYVFSKKVDAFSIFSTEPGDIYSRYLTYNTEEGLDILSGEDLNTEVFIHMLTRPIKMQSPDSYKKINRLIARCELHRESDTGYFSFGVWGKQDLNKHKVNIPLVAFKDASADKFPNGIRQDIPVGRQKGKYKVITILQSGKLLPKSSISGYDIVAIKVDNKTLR